MSKLKKLSGEDHVQKFYEDPYHCCRWCHWSKIEDPFEGRKCFFDKESVEVDTCVQDVYEVAETGLLSQTIEEVLNTEKLSDKLMYKLMDCFQNWRISDKKREEFMKHFREEWSEFADFDLKPELDEKISVLYQKRAEEFSNSDGFVVSDDFCCKHFE